MRLPWLVPGLIALALGLVGPRVALAQLDGPASIAVLGLEPIDVPATVTDEISEQLRQRVAAARELHLVSGKDLVEVKLVFSCADESATCMAQAGKSLDAQKLIYGSVKRAGDEYAVWLKMFDVRRAKIDSWLTETIPRKNADSAGIKAASGRWVAKLTGRPGAMGSGTIQVTANLAGATVALDGVPAGLTREGAALALSDVAPGRHELVLSKAGHTSVRQAVSIAAGQTLPVALTLGAPGGTSGGVTPQPFAAQAVDGERSATPAAGATDTGADRRAGYRTGFWVTFVAGLASAGAAVKFGLDVSDVNGKLDPYRRFPCSGNQLCDSKGNVRPALTAAEKSQADKLNDEGSRGQTRQWICVGLGAALGAASGYLLYKGYLDSDEASAEHQAHHGLRIFPTASAAGSGIVAEFDF